jgi:hypoxanthine-guanine phosphoribosyltransferase
MVQIQKKINEVAQEIKEDSERKDWFLLYFLEFMD